MECPPLLYPMKSEPAEPTTDPLAADNDLLQNSAEEPIFHCNLCGEMFSSEKDLKDHKLTHAKCRVCSESFQSDEAKNEHERLHYSAKAGFLYCLICKVDVKNRDHFNIHAGEFRHEFIGFLFFLLNFEVVLSLLECFFFEMGSSTSFVRWSVCILLFGFVEDEKIIWEYICSI